MLTCVATFAALLPSTTDPVVRAHTHIRTHATRTGRPISGLGEPIDAIGLGSALAAVATAAWWTQQRVELTSSEDDVDLPVWTAEALKNHDGSDPDLPLLLAADGLIFNVESARRLYGPGAEYAAFAGCDATRLLAKGVIREEPSEADAPLNFVQRAALGAWLSSFRRKYEIVGTLYIAPEAEAAAAAAEEAQAAGERLLLAAVAGDVNLLRHELQLGTPIDFCDDSGWQALHYASNNGRVEATRVLLEAGASVGSIGSKGRTALHHAAEKDHVEIVEVRRNSFNLVIASRTSAQTLTQTRTRTLRKPEP